MIAAMPDGSLIRLLSKLAIFAHADDGGMLTCRVDGTVSSIASVKRFLFTPHSRHNCRDAEGNQLRPAHRQMLRDPYRERVIDYTSWGRVFGHLVGNRVAIIANMPVDTAILLRDGRSAKLLKYTDLLSRTLPVVNVFTGEVTDCHTVLELRGDGVSFDDYYTPYGSLLNDFIPLHLGTAQSRPAQSFGSPAQEILPGEET